MLLFLCTKFILKVISVCFSTSCIELRAGKVGKLNKFLRTCILFSVQSVRSYNFSCILGVCIFSVTSHVSSRKNGNGSWVAVGRYVCTV